MCSNLHCTEQNNNQFVDEKYYGMRLYNVHTMKYSMNTHFLFNAIPRSTFFNHFCSVRFCSVCLFIILSLLFAVLHALCLQKKIVRQKSSERKQNGVETKNKLKWISNSTLLQIIYAWNCMLELRYYVVCVATRRLHLHLCVLYAAALILELYWTHSKMQKLFQ